MRVMFWSAIHWPHIGGVQELANNLLPALQERGHRFIVVSEQDPPDLASHEEHHGIPIYRFPLRRGLRDIDELARIRSRIRELEEGFSPDLHHTVALGATDFYYQISVRPHTAPRLVSLFGRWPTMYGRFLGKLLSTADRIVCDSADSLEYAEDLASGMSPRCCVIRNALPVPAQEPTPLSWHPPHVLYLGRLSREKGVDLALTALSMLTARHPRSRLIVAGDGPDRGILEQQARDLNLSERVCFKGWVPQEDVPSLLNKAVMLVLPSRSDSFPLAGLQASLMQRPIVATRVGGLPELVIDHQTGLLVEQEDPSALAGAMSALLDDPERTVQMGKAARNRVLAEFGFEAMVEAYEAVYRKVVHGAFPSDEQASLRSAG